MKVVIVESPAKAKTINKYLGKDYEVYASFGHVRDLTAKDGSVDPDDDFAMRWEVDAKSAKRMSDIGSAVRTADRVILATDPDREGEAISWHIHEILKNKKLLKDKRVDRVVFNAVTKDAVQEAMRNPREIDDAHAQPASWIASRHALISALPCVLGLAIATLRTAAEHSTRNHMSSAREAVESIDANWE